MTTSVPALAPDAPVLVVDGLRKSLDGREMLSGIAALDPEFSDDIAVLIRELAASGMAVIAVTHEIRLARRPPTRASSWMAA